MKNFNSFKDFSCKGYVITAFCSFTPKILCLLAYLAFTGTIYGQKCTDLIVTEIVFGGIGTTPSDGTTQFNHSIEVYNPTDVPIDLSNYSIELVPESGNATVIQLEGIVPVEDVFVISNVTANNGITAVSDVLDLLLSFQGKVAIQLKKSNGEILDKIGRQGIQQSSQVIDFNALLNTPGYLNSFDINLGSIENLLIRRKGFIQKGNANFLNEDLIKEWIVLPNFEISDLGSHLNACSVPMIYWEDVDQFAPEKILLEIDGASTVGVLDYLDHAIGKVLLTEAHDAPLSFSVFASSHEYPFPINEPDASFADWSSINLAMDFIIPAGDLSYTFDPLAWAIQDANPEISEGFGLKVSAAIGGEVISDPDNDLFDIQIVDPPTNTQEFDYLNKQISIYPVIANNNLNIRCLDVSAQIEKIAVLTLEGKKLQSFDFDTYRIESLSIDISNIDSKGYHLLVIKTSKGMVTKKFYKN